MADLGDQVTADQKSAAPSAEPMKRFTIDVPVELHRRVRAACARRGLRPSSVLRDLLEREFPETTSQSRSRAMPTAPAAA